MFFFSPSLSALKKGFGIGIVKKKKKREKERERVFAFRGGEREEDLPGSGSLATVTGASLRRHR